MQKWIPVEEGLPKLGQKCIVTVKHAGRIFVDCDEYGSSIYGGVGASLFWTWGDCVIAWMPMPEVYEMEDENK